MIKKEIKACLNLFKSYIVDETLKDNIDAKYIYLKNGILYNTNHLIPQEVSSLVLDMFGKKPEEWNNTFHKSFKTVFDTPIEDLITQQLIHYFTTYGLESIGLYNEAFVYIPAEKLEIPELENDIPLVVINEITEDQLKEKLMVLLTSNIALSKSTIEDILTLYKYIDKDKVEEINNREVKIALYEKFKIVPCNNIEFLRYLIYKTTNNTLLIKNRDLRHKIQKADRDLSYNLFQTYLNSKEDYIKLAQIYQRYKQLFLSYKTKKAEKLVEKKLNTIINKINKYSKKYHEKFIMNILDMILEIDNENDVDLLQERINEALNKSSIFREVRILNSLSYRINNNETTNPLIYKVRNNTIHTIEYNQINEIKINAYKKLYKNIYNHLINRLKNKLENKTIYIPDNINYTVPVSEKQYIGNFPEGTILTLPRNNDLVVGIHWTNLPRERVDLDLSLSNLSDTYSWCQLLKDVNATIAFSGDMTDAPISKNGASEFFLIKSNIEPSKYLLAVSDYTQIDKEIPFELIIGSKIENDKFKQNYIIDPNNVLANIPFIFNNNWKYQQSLGLINITSSNIQFIFNNFDLNGNKVFTVNKYNEITFKYLSNNIDSQLKLRDLLRDVGMKLLTEPYIEKLENVGKDENNEDLYKKKCIKADYDLSLDSLDKTIIIDLFKE